VAHRRAIIHGDPRRHRKPSVEISDHHQPQCPVSLAAPCRDPTWNQGDG
jgi:hypothetical protein